MRVPFDERRLQGVSVTGGTSRVPELANLGAKRAPTASSRAFYTGTAITTLSTFLDYLGYLYNPLRAKNVPQIYCVYIPPLLSSSEWMPVPYTPMVVVEERARVFSGCTKQNKSLNKRLHDSSAMIHATSQRDNCLLSMYGCV